MTNKAVNAVTITQLDLKEQRPDAQALIERVSWKVSSDVNYSDPTNVYVPGLGRERDEQVSLTTLFEKLDPSDSLPSDVQMHVLRAIRGGLQVARHVSDSYGERAGIPDSNRGAGLTEIQLTEINVKKQTSAAIALFCFSRYLLWDLRELTERNDYLETVSATIPEVELSRLVPALRSAVFYLGKNIETKAQSDDGRLVAVVWRFAEQLQMEILNRLGVFQHQAAFADVNYLLEETDFSIHGFEVARFGGTKSAEVKRVERDEVIGNSEAMKPLFAAVQKLMLYDVVRQMNPLLALGKFPAVIGYDGEPGNGKTLAMSAGATYFVDLAIEMGLPHKVMIVPSFVDKYQGESQKQAQQWCDEFFDPTSVKFGVGDEFEQTMGDHGSDSASEGSKEVSTTFLKAFDGVGTIPRGHSTFLYGTNYRELINPAFLSRTNLRAFVGGAETLNDYVRFIVLMLKKVNQNFPGLVNYKNIDWDMNLRAPQVPDLDDNIFVDPSATVEEVLAQAQSMHDADDVLFLARFFWLMKRRFAAFSLRDCKNTIEAATSQMANFEVPMEFIQNAAAYSEKSFEEKQGLLTELARAHVGSLGTDFVSLINDRAHYYAADALRTADVRHTRAVKDLAGQMLVRADADVKIRELLEERRKLAGTAKAA
jgi:hypothetical protein